MKLDDSRQAVSAAGKATTAGVSNGSAGAPIVTSARRCPWLLVLLVWIACAVLVGWARTPITGLFAATYLSLTLVALLSPTAGLWIALTAALYDRFFYVYINWQHQDWIPPQIHLVDLAAVAVCLSFAVRFAARRARMRWQWYDTAFAIFLGFMALAAIHGALLRYEHFLKMARMLPALALYFPAREACERADRDALHRNAIIYCVVVTVLAGFFAWLAKPIIAYRSDILLPRLLRVTNITPILILPALAWPRYLSSVRWRSRLATGLVLVLAGAAIANDNTRSAIATVLGAALIFIWCSRKLAPSRREFAQAIAAVLIFGVGFSMVHAIRLRRESRHYQHLKRLEQTWKQQHPGKEPPLRLSPSRPRTIPQAVGVVPSRLKVDDSLVNRWNEIRLLGTFGPAEFLLGRGLGAPVDYPGLAWNGGPKEVHWWKIHNAYAYVLYSAGLMALLSLLAVAAGVPVLLWRRINLSPSPDTAAALLTVLVIGASINVIASVFFYGAAWSGTLWGLAGGWALPHVGRPSERR